MCDSWQENPDDRPTFEELASRFDQYLVENEPIYENAIYTEC